MIRFFVIGVLVIISSFGTTESSEYCNSEEHSLNEPIFMLESLYSPGFYLTTNSALQKGTFQIKPVELWHEKVWEVYPQNNTTRSFKITVKKGDKFIPLDEEINSLKEMIRHQSKTIQNQHDRIKYLEGILR